MAIAAHRAAIEQHQIFGERRRRGDYVARCIHGETAAVEDKLIVAAGLVDINQRQMEMAGRGAEHGAAKRALLHVVGRSVDADQQTGASIGKLLHGIAAIEAALPILLVVPDVFADRKRRLGSANLNGKLLLGGLEVARLVENVVSRE